MKTYKYVPQRNGSAKLVHDVIFVLDIIYHPLGVKIRESGIFSLGTYSDVSLILILATFLDFLVFK